MHKIDPANKPQFVPLVTFSPVHDNQTLADAIRTTICATDPLSSYMPATKKDANT
jgi:hypothetical protein